MAKQDDGINGGYRGKVGPVVGYMWRGQWCTRTMPRFYHDAKTEAQLEQRELFKAEVAFAGRVKEVLHAGFYKPALAAHKTECNYFLMVNKNCFAWNEGLAVDYNHLRVSEGPVAPVGFGEPVCQPDYTLLRQRVDTLLSQARDTLLSQPHAADSSPNLGEQLLTLPKTMVSGTSPKLGEVDARRADGGVCLTIPFEKNPEHRRCEADDRVYVAAFCDGEAMLSLPVYRRTRSITIELPAEWTGHEVHLYGFVQDSASRTSDSIYLGVILTQYTPEHEKITLDTPDLLEPSAEESVSTGVSRIMSGGVPEADSRQSAGVLSLPPDI